MHMWLRRFGTDKRGIAAVEFALLLPVLMLALGFAVDAALAYRTKLRLISGVSAAVQFANSKSVGLTAAQVPALIEATGQVVAFVAGTVASAKTEVRVNNAPSAINFHDFYCVGGNSPETWKWSSTGPSSGVCSGNVPSSKYMTVVATAKVRTYFLPQTIADQIAQVRDYAIVDLAAE